MADKAANHSTKGTRDSLQVEGPSLKLQLVFDELGEETNLLISKSPLLELSVYQKNGVMISVR